MMKVDELKEFFDDISDLKHTEREGWKKRDISEPLDTIASHSFGAALIGWIMAEEEGVNADKVVKMLLLHDLIMAYLPDYTPQDEEFDNKKEIEEKRMEMLMESIPESVRLEFEGLILDLRENDSAEAQLAEEADKLDTILQAIKYSEISDNSFEKEFLEFYSDRFETETGTRMYRRLNDSAETSDSS